MIIELETPSTGTDVGTGAGRDEVYAWGWGQVDIVVSIVFVSTHPLASRSTTCDAGDPKRATSSC